MSDRSSSSSLPAAIVVAVLSVFVMGYALLIVQEILLGVLVVAILVGLYVLLRVISAVEAIADALQRIARKMEDE